MSADERQAAAVRVLLHVGDMHDEGCPAWVTPSFTTPPAPPDPDACDCRIIGRARRSVAALDDAGLLRSLKDSS